MKSCWIPELNVLRPARGHVNHRGSLENSSCLPARHIAPQRKDQHPHCHDGEGASSRSNAIGLSCASPVPTGNATQTPSDPPGRAPGLISRGWIPRVSHIQGELPILGCARDPTPRSPPMRALTTIAVLLAGGASSLCAQHGRAIEIGGYPSLPRYGGPVPRGKPLGARGRRRVPPGDPLRL